MLVDKYEYDIPEIIDNLKDIAVKDMKKADIVLMTAHSTKGLEFEKVIVADDFISIEKINEKRERLELDYPLDVQESKVDFSFGSFLNLEDE